MDKPLISIVIPAYNAEATIGSTLTSVFEQTYRPLEIILVDDGSQDETPWIVDRYGRKAHKDVEVILLRQENQGPSAARNLGIERSKGDFIALLDADDLWIMRDKLERQMALFRRDQSLGLTFTNVCTKKVHGEEVIMFDRQRLGRQFFGHEYLVVNPLEKLLYTNFIPTSSVLAKRDCFRGGLLFNTKRRHAEDWELWLKLALRFHLGYLTDVCVYKKEDHGGLSQDCLAMVLSKLEIMEDFLSQHRRELVSRVGTSLLSKRVRDFYHYSAHWLRINRGRQEARKWFLKAAREALDIRSLVFYLWCLLPG